MSVAKPVRTVTRQRILISWRCVSAIKASLIPILGVTMKFGVRADDIFPLLNCHSTKFSIGPICKLSTAVQVEKVFEQLNCGLLLKIDLTKYLEIANIGHKILSNILRVELEAGKHISEIF